MTPAEIVYVDREIDDRASTIEAYQAELAKILGRAVTAEEVWEWLLSCDEPDHGYGHGV